LKKKFFIIDGHALCYRAYFAFIKNPLTNSKGQNTSAIFGFSRMLLRLIEDQKPDYLAVAFDPPKKSFRFDLYAEYKATRQKMPDDLRPQIDEIISMIKKFGIPVLINDNFEADDILGTAAGLFPSDKLDVYIVTGDKDAFQLVADGVYIYRNSKGISEYEILSRDGIIEKTGLPPEKIIDYMALTGDTSDNVPGVKGVGEKTALKLINEYGSLDGVYSSIDSIKGKLKEQLLGNTENAYLSRTLVTIRKDVPLDISLDDLSFKGIPAEDALEFFTSHEMESIIRDHFSSAEDARANPVLAQSIPGRDSYRIVMDKTGMENALKAVYDTGFVSIDTETTSVDPVRAGLVGISLSVKPGEGWYVPLAGSGLFSEKLPDREQMLSLIKPMVEDHAVKKIGQNLKYDIIVFQNEGMKLNGLHSDTMIASYLLYPSDRRHNLDDMAMNHLQYKTITYNELVGSGKNAVNIDEVELDRLADYAIEDADIALRLNNLLEPRLHEQELDSLYRDMELPLVYVLAGMERTGVKIDPVHFKKLGELNDRKLEEVRAKIISDAGREFNINSTRELAAVLFEELGLKPQKKTKTGFSTDITVLESLIGRHSIIESLIEYRTLSKLKNTYIDTLPELIFSGTGRIHTSYNQTVAATGRLSSSEPNLQNIPIRDEFGRLIRKGFIAEKGSLIMAADYSQIELRLAAHLSGDANMTSAFKNGIDIHSMTASSVFKVEIPQITPDMRRQAKIINFATIYGVSPFGLSQQAEISVKDAAEFIRIYFETYPGFRKYIDETVKFAVEKGYVKTLFGRKRAIPDITSETHFKREGAERIAINTPIQGTSADMIKIAMIRIAAELKNKNYKSRMIMQVHDELVFEVVEDEIDEMKSMVKSMMENSAELDVPVVVDIGIGDNWNDAH
jgi:DNA polymerase-1